MVAWTARIPLRAKGLIAGTIGATVGFPVTARPAVVTFPIAVNAAHATAYSVTAGDAFHLLVSKHFLYTA